MLAKKIRSLQYYNRKHRKIIADLLDMLEEWDPGHKSDGMSGFGGFHVVNRAERALGREESNPE